MIPYDRDDTAMMSTVFLNPILSLINPPIIGAEKAPIALHELYIPDAKSEIFAIVASSSWATFSFYFTASIISAMSGTNTRL